MGIEEDKTRKVSIETWRDQTRSERIDHPPEASLGWCSETQTTFHPGICVSMSWVSTGFAAARD